jgi:hypothetical protein
MVTLCNTLYDEHFANRMRDPRGCLRSSTCATTELPRTRRARQQLGGVSEAGETPEAMRE